MKSKIENGHLVLTRSFDAPRAVVFEAWTQTETVERWFGCGQAERVESYLEPNEGGAFTHILTLAGVGEFPIRARFTEFTPPERLAYAWTDEATGTEQTVEVSFQELSGGRTELTLRHGPLPETITDIVTAGWTAGLDKLSELLTA